MIAAALSPALLAVATVVALGALAALFTRRPDALPLAVVLALPVHVPVEVGDTVRELPVALNVVIAAGVLAVVVGRLHEGPPPAARPPLGPTDAPSDRHPLRALTWLLAAVVLAYAVQALRSDGTARDHAVQDVVLFQLPFLVLFLLLSRTVWTRALVVRVLGVAAAVAVVLAGVGIAERAASQVLVSPELAAASRADSSLRIGSLFFDPDLFGRWLVVVAIGVAAAAAGLRRARDVALAAFALAVLWGGLVVTLSRPSFGALLAGLAVLATLLAARRRAAVAVAGVAALAAGLAVAALTADGALDRRWEVVSDGARVFADHLALGAGSGGAPSVARIEPVAVAAEQGLLGLALYVALLAAGLAVLLRGARGDRVRAGLAAAFVVVVVHAWGAGAFLEDPLPWALLGAGVALAPPSLGLRERLRLLRLSRRPARARAAAPPPPVPAGRG